jgi:hypothetical protein
MTADFNRMLLPACCRALFRALTRIQVPALLAGLSMLIAAPVQAAPVTGFRTASFGSSEADVRSAIQKDLGVNANQIQASDDAMHGTRILSVKLERFAPLNLPAQVDYLMGAHCRCLIRVVVGWAVADNSAERSQALAGVSALAQRFSSESWGEGKAVVNRVLGDVKTGQDLGMVFFRGEEGAALVVLLGGPVTVTPQAGAGDAKAGTPPGVVADVDHLRSISLVYEADVAHPDVLTNQLAGF